MNDLLAQKQKITFIIPTKNEENRLGRCLSSIKRLICDNCNIEIIVVDNGSTDTTVNIAVDLGAKVFIRPKDTIAGLRNFGAKISNGQFLVFIDADIELKLGFLRNALKHFKNPKTGIVTGQILIPQRATWVEQAWCLGRTTHDQMKEINWSSSMNMIVSRDSFIDVNGFSANMITCEDVDFSQKIKEKGYLIVYDHQVKVVHFGEAKTLKDFFRKERWRGFNAFTLVRKYPGDYRRWLSFLQIPFFSFSFITTIISYLFLQNRIAFLSFLCFILLPFSRACIISIKNTSVRYFFNLFIVWFIYYCARTVSLFDAVIGEKQGS